MSRLVTQQHQLMLLLQGSNMQLLSQFQSVGVCLALHCVYADVEKLQGERFSGISPLKLDPLRLYDLGLLTQCLLRKPDVLSKQVQFVELEDPG